MTQREEKGMAMVHGTQRMKRKEKNEVAEVDGEGAAELK